MPVQLGPNPPQLVSQSELREESRGIREDFIVIFGLFASLLIFLGLEVQVLQKAPRFSMLVGLSCFMLGAILAFALAMHNIVKGNNSFGAYFKNPLVYFVIACLLASIGCFAWGAFHKPIDFSKKPAQSSAQKTTSTPKAQSKISNNFPFTSN